MSSDPLPSHLIWHLRTESQRSKVTLERKSFRGKEVCHRALFFFSPLISLSASKYEAIIPSTRMRNNNDKQISADSSRPPNKTQEYTVHDYTSKILARSAISCTHPNDTVDEHNANGIHSDTPTISIRRRRQRQPTYCTRCHRIHLIIYSDRIHLNYHINRIFVRSHTRDSIRRCRDRISNTNVSSYLISSMNIYNPYIAIKKHLPRVKLEDVCYTRSSFSSLGVPNVRLKPFLFSYLPV